MNLTNNLTCLNIKTNNNIITNFVINWSGLKCLHRIFTNLSRINYIIIIKITTNLITFINQSMSISFNIIINI